MKINTVNDYLATHLDLDEVANSVLEQIKSLTPSEATAVLKMVEAKLIVVVDDVTLSNY